MSTYPDDCPVAATLDAVGDRWTLLSFATSCAASRATAISPARSTPIAPNLLAGRLRRLEDLGLVTRERYSERPLRASYALTERGRALAPVIVTLGRFGIDHLDRPEPDYLAAHIGCGGRVPPTAWRCLTCGDDVTAGDLELLPPAQIAAPAVAAAAVDAHHDRGRGATCVGCAPPGSTAAPVSRLGAMRILLVGSGGREHALAQALAASPTCRELHCAPGNPGIARVATCHDVAVDDIGGLVALAHRPRGRARRDRAGAAARARSRRRAAARADPGLRPVVGRRARRGLEGVLEEADAGRGRADRALLDVHRQRRRALRAVDELGGACVVKADGLAAGKGVDGLPRPRRGTRRRSTRASSAEPSARPAAWS